MNVYLIIMSALCHLIFCNILPKITKKSMFSLYQNVFLIIITEQLVIWVKIPDFQLLSKPL